LVKQKGGKKTKKEREEDTIIRNFWNVSRKLQIRLLFAKKPTTIQIFPIEKYCSNNGGKFQQIEKDSIIAFSNNRYCLQSSNNIYKLEFDFKSR
jgi:hypothetical protein